MYVRGNRLEASARRIGERGVWRFRGAARVRVDAEQRDVGVIAPKTFGDIDSSARTGVRHHCGLRGIEPVHVESLEAGKAGMRIRYDSGRGVERHRGFLAGISVDHVDEAIVRAESDAVRIEAAAEAARSTVAGSRIRRRFGRLLCHWRRQHLFDQPGNRRGQLGRGRSLSRQRGGFGEWGMGDLRRLLRVEQHTT